MIMADKLYEDEQRDERFLAIPGFAREIGVTPRVLRYWEEQGLIRPSRERGKLRYSPRDVRMAVLIQRLLDHGMGVDGVRVVRMLAEREILQAAGQEDEMALTELTLRAAYQRKLLDELTSSGNPSEPTNLAPEGPKHRHRPHPPGGRGPARRPRGPRPG